MRTADVPARGLESAASIPRSANCSVIEEEVGLGSALSRFFFHLRDSKCARKMMKLEASTVNT